MSDTKKKIRTKQGSASLEALLCLCTAPCRGNMLLRRRTGRTVGRDILPCSIELDHIFAECVA